MTDQLVSVQWLKEHIKDKHIILLDASATFDATLTIDGAQHFDIKNIFSDTESPFPNTFPKAEQFEKECQKLGINTSSHIIVFDNKGIFNSPRVWWLFKTMGHDNISVLDGGLPEWTSSNLSTEYLKAPKPTIGNFTSQLQPTAVKRYDQIVKNTKTSDYQVIDARSSGRFNGTTPEPRAHIQSGSIKNSINLPYTEVLSNGKYKTKEELATIFNNLKLTSKPIIFSCGSGITACVILFAFNLISDQASSIYDGSWTEWAEKQELFV